jgi:hypothetical protein
MDIFSNLQPHCGMICGRRGSGKSVFACQLLETNFKDHFDSIIIICPTFHINKAFQREWITNKKDKNVHIVGKKTFDRYDLSDILLYLSKRFECCGHTLFLIDDCAFLGGVRHKETTLNQLAFTSRHAGISIWVITQKYNAVSKDFREQLSWIVLFYCKDKDSFIYANDENSVLDGNERTVAGDFLKSNAHGKLVIRTDPPIQYKLLK